MCVMWTRGIVGFKVYPSSQIYAQLTVKTLEQCIDEFKIINRNTKNDIS